MALPLAFGPEAWPKMLPSQSLRDVCFEGVPRVWLCPPSSATLLLAPCMVPLIKDWPNLFFSQRPVVPDLPCNAIGLIKEFSEVHIRKWNPFQVVQEKPIVQHGRDDDWKANGAHVAKSKRWLRDAAGLQRLLWVPSNSTWLLAGSGKRFISKRRLPVKFS